MGRWFSRFSSAVAHAAGTPSAFIAACLLVLVWAAFGPAFHWSSDHSLFINTATTIITFLMIFLVQNTQNRDSAALQAKIDELIATSKADNRFVGLDHLSDEEIEALRRECEERART